MRKLIVSLVVAVVGVGLPAANGGGDELDGVDHDLWAGDHHQRRAAH